MEAPLTSMQRDKPSQILCLRSQSLAAAMSGKQSLNHRSPRAPQSSPSRRRKPSAHAVMGTIKHNIKL